MIASAADQAVYYARQSPITDPGPYRHLLAELPPDPAALCHVTHGLVIHQSLGHLYGWSIPPERMPSAELRGVKAILAHMQTLDPQPLRVPRPPERRFVGHCRVSAVLLCSMLRTHGFPACARAGFQAYHGRGFDANTWDHWICEYWDATRRRWILIDPEQDDVLLADTGFTIDPYDIPRDRFITAGQAWLACRRGAVDPVQFGLDPSDAGLDYVRGHLLRDLAALNKWEAAGADRWGLSGMSASSLSDSDLALLDHVATLTHDGARACASIREVYLRDPRLRPTLS